jgi:hypothetical protein
MVLWAMPTRLVPGSIPVSPFPGPGLDGPRHGFGLETEKLVQQTIPSLKVRLGE